MPTLLCQVLFLDSTKYFLLFCAYFTEPLSLGGNVTFLSPNKKVTKEVGIGEALSSALPRRKTPSPMYLSRRALGIRGAP